MSRRALVRQHRPAILALAERYGASDLRLIGSVARGDDRPDSDIDFLVRMNPGRSLLDRAGLVVALEDLLGCKVDVVNEGGVGPRFLSRISDDLVAL